MAFNTERIAFLELVNFQLLYGRSATDAELVDIVRDVWDSAVNTTDPVGRDSASFPTSCIGVSMSWDENNNGCVFELNDIVLTDNFEDTTEPPVVDLGEDFAMTWDDDEYVELSGGAYDGELFVLDMTA